MVISGRLVGNYISIILLTCCSLQDLPTPPSSDIPLNAGKTDLELFKVHTCELYILQVLMKVYICLDVIRRSTGAKRTSGTTFEPQLVRSTLTFYMGCSAEAGIVQVIMYLRRSRAFQPSEAWQPLLEEAVQAVLPRHKPWD